ncbi:hypothetical protein AMTRI_Chr09g39660 [Amborella trichopoda]
MTMNGSSNGGGSEIVDWERPRGMLVQKRSLGSDHASSTPAPTIRVDSQATFGELKKLLASKTVLHTQDQKLLFKDKERDSNAYLDMAGVKDKSKIVYIEMRKNANMKRASKYIARISLEVDKLADQNEVLGLIELLMNQLLKLDGIVADGDWPGVRRYLLKPWVYQEMKPKNRGYGDIQQRNNPNS